MTPDDNGLDQDILSATSEVDWGGDLRKVELGSALAEQYGPANQRCLAPMRQNTSRQGSAERDSARVAQQAHQIEILPSRGHPPRSLSILAGEALGTIRFEEVDLYAVQKFQCGELAEQRPERHPAMRHREIHLWSARSEADNWKAVFG